MTISIKLLSDWIIVLNLLEKYEKASNSRINKQKTCLMPLTNTARRVELLEETQFKKLEEQKFTTVLGYSIKNNSSPKKNL